MTDAPSHNTHLMPFTVLLMIPDNMRSDESCEADWVRRIWVHATNPDEALSAAQAECISLFEWDEDTDAECLAPVAIYHGQIFDMFQP